MKLKTLTDLHSILTSTYSNASGIYWNAAFESVIDLTVSLVAEYELIRAASLEKVFESIERGEWRLQNDADSFGTGVHVNYI